MSDVQPKSQSSSSQSVDPRLQLPVYSTTEKMLNPWEEEQPPSPECRSSSTDDDGINEMERQWLAQMRDHSRFPPMQAQPTQIFASGQQKLSTDFDLIRWALAYGGNVDTAVHKFRRHLRIREILHLDNIEKLDQADGLDVEADEYAPVDILGQISDRDRRILLLERSGRFQLDQMMQSIRTSSFMLNRFRLMERIRRAVQQSEQATGRRQSALLVMDLDGMGFQPALVSFISGAYRIMWGTLMEQYPSLLSAIIVLNCPTSVSALWAACAPFVGEYRHRIHLLGRDWQQRLPPELLIVEALPIEYGGLRQCQLREPRPCRLSPLEMGPAELAELEQLSIPAGDFLVRTYFLVEDQLLQFVLGHEQELTLNGWMGMEKRLIRPAEAAESEELEEVLAGCERPGMPTLDSWLWTVPRGGFFHLAFGNQKAWILAVPLKFQLFQLHPNGQRVKMHPIPASQLRALG